MIEKIKRDCYWCEKQFYTEIGRTYHLYKRHPKFFEEYDKLNGLIGSHKIPERPKYFRCRKCEFETDNHREILDHIHNHTDKDREDENIRRRSLIDYSDEFKNMNQKEKLRIVKTVKRKPEGDKE